MTSSPVFEAGSTEQAGQSSAPASSDNLIFWRVEGSLLSLTAVRPVGFFAWNAQSFLERWARRGAMGLLALGRPFLYASNRGIATRVLHTVLRGVSQDRLDLLGEEYFEYILKARLKPQGLATLRQMISRGHAVVLVSQGLDHIMRPLAREVGAQYLISNRLEFREGRATGRLLNPVVPPRGPLARILGANPDGRMSREQVLRVCRLRREPLLLEAAVRPARRPAALPPLPVLQANGARPVPLSVRHSLAGKQVLLIGATGFIGKVWLANLLSDLPEIAKVYVLVRRSRSQSALDRFRKMLEESPVFEPLHARHGDGLSAFLAARLEVIEGDVSEPHLGMAPAAEARLAATLDLLVNSSGLTDFNPDLRDALAANVRSVAHMLEFLRHCDHAALLHLSTCYVAGARDGRIHETLQPDYTPLNLPDFDAGAEWRALEALVRDTEHRAESAEITQELTRQALAKRTAAKHLHGPALENQVRKNRLRWIRQTLIDAGTTRAISLGWPNTYTFTKSLAESLIHKRGRRQTGRAEELPVAIVRPAIVESSLEKPFRGWNEGINTSASLSYLLGTYFRQLPTNERKCLDIIPVDLVTRGITLIAAALVQRRHQAVYHLATSVSNPCDMRRSIELTSLAHRKFYRSQDGFDHWLRSRFDAIPVSKSRYEKLSAPAQRAIVQAINRSFEALLERPPLAKRERELERVIKLIALFEPFILRNNHVFEAYGVETLSALLPDSERRDFGYDARAIDWWEYWIEIHIPALRKWSYPLIEGRPLHPATRHAVSFPEIQRQGDQIGRAAPASSL